MTSSLFFISKAIKEGTLRKKSPQLPNKWSSRHVILYEDALVYYSTKDAAKPRGVIPLQYVITAMPATDHDAGKSSKSDAPIGIRFEVVIRCTPSMKVFHWAASSDQEAQSWIQEVKKACEAVKAAQAKDPGEFFVGPPPPGFWKDVVGLGVARARAANIKNKVAEEKELPLARGPRSASASAVFYAPPKEETLAAGPVEDRNQGSGSRGKSHARGSSQGIGWVTSVKGAGIPGLGMLGKEESYRIISESEPGTPPPSIGQHPVLVGILSKRSPRGLHLWQKRHFTLFADMLIYSKTDGSPVLGAVPLECVDSVGIIEITETHGQFNIVINHKRDSAPKILEIMAPTPQECTIWVEALHLACPNLLVKKGRSAAHERGGSPPGISRSESSSSLTRTTSDLLEFDLSQPYVEKPASPPSPKHADKHPEPELARSGRKVSGATVVTHMTRSPSFQAHSPILKTSLPPIDQNTVVISTAPLPPPPPLPSSSASAPALTSPIVAPSPPSSAPSSASSSPTKPNPPKPPPPPTPSPPSPPHSAASATTVIDDVFPSPFTVIVPIFAASKTKAPPPPPVHHGPTPSMDAANDEPPEYASSSDSEDIPRTSFAAISSAENVTTVTTFYRNKTTDDSDSEDYVLVDLDGEDNSGESKMPSFLPRDNREASRKLAQAPRVWATIQHKPAGFSPKLETTKLDPSRVPHLDSAAREKDLVLLLGPTKALGLQTHSPAPSPPLTAKTLPDPPPLVAEKEMHERVKEGDKLGPVRVSKASRHPHFHTGSLKESVKLKEPEKRSRNISTGGLPRVAEGKSSQSPKSKPQLPSVSEVPKPYLADEEGSSEEEEVETPEWVQNRLLNDKADKVAEKVAEKLAEKSLGSSMSKFFRNRTISKA